MFQTDSALRMVADSGGSTVFILNGFQAMQSGSEDPSKPKQ